MHKGSFRGYQIIKRVRVVDSKLRAQLIQALYKGIADGASLKACFDPGLGIRAIKGKHQVDLLICFGCSWVVANTDGKEESVAISQTPKNLFDRILARTH